jgi:signal transduction histidine kinase/CheY-like chemotaxis protein
MMPSRRSYVVLALLFAVAIAYYAVYFHHVVSLVGHLSERARAPLGCMGTLVSSVEKEATASGIRVGDTIEEIAGKPFAGKWVLDQSIKRLRPGSALSIGIRHPDGTSTHIFIKLARMREEPAGVREWLFYGTVFLVVPSLCVILGFAVAAIRPWDFRAWLLLMLLLSFPQLYRVSGWDGPFPAAAFAYQGLAGSTFGMWLVLFGIHFPDRARWDRKRPWLKWPFVLLLAALALIGVSEDVASQTNFAIFAPFESLMPLLWNAVLILNLVAVVFFVYHLLTKNGGASTPDGRRRVRILLFGSALSCGPMFVLVAVGLIRGASAFAVAPWLVIATVLLLALFPCTLAYVMVVQRAFGPRMLIRESIILAGAPPALEMFRLLITLGVVTYFAYQPTMTQIAKGTVFVSAITLLFFLRPRFVGRLVLLIDRHFFPADYAAQQTLAALQNQARLLTDPQPMLKDLAHRIADALGVSQVAVLMKGLNGFGVSETADGFSVGETAAPLRFSSESHIIQRLCRLNHAVLINFDDPASWVHRSNPEEQEMLKALHARVLLKLADADELFGIISVGPKRSEEPYSATDLQLLESVAASTSMAIQDSRLISTIAGQAAANERITAEKSAAEQADQVKSDFLARMSHELRTPLNAIIGYSELLLEEVEESGADNLAPDLKKILWSGNHLLGLINALLDISKIEAGKVELYEETFAIKTVVQEVLQAVQLLVKAKGNTLQCEFGDDLGTMVTDITKVRQCLFNLLSNASKFTDKGLVIVRVTRCHEANGEWARFRVEDSGIGMTPEQLSKLFRPFVQADPSITSKYGGTGLGLSISRRFSQMMGGDIEVESELGRGSTFTMTIPVHSSRAAANHGNDKARRVVEILPNNGGTVLVINDDPAVHDLMRQSLGGDGFRVIEASSGGEALRKVRELRPDAITLDVMMGGMDGWSVLSELKSDPEFSEIPIIVVTLLEDKKIGFSLGANGYLVEPLDRSKLVSLLSQYYPASRIAALGSRCVLVVDGDAATRASLRGILEADNWKVCLAQSGQHALEHLAAVATDLVLVGLSMAETDGLWLISEIRKSPVWYNIPVVVIAAKTLTVEGRLLLRANVAHLLQKRPSVLEEVLRDVTLQVAASVGHGEKTHA